MIIWWKVVWKGNVETYCVKFLTCNHSHPTLLHYPTLLPEKYSNNTKAHNCTMSRSCYRLTNCQTYHKESKHDACYDTRWMWPNLCDGNNLSEKKAEGQEPLWYHKCHLWYRKIHSQNLMRQLDASSKKCYITLNTPGEHKQLQSQSFCGLQINIIYVTELILHRTAIFGKFCEPTIGFKGNWHLKV